MNVHDNSSDILPAATGTSLTTEELRHLAGLSPEAIVQACGLAEVKAVAQRLEEDFRS